jgi:hypothetical protein
MDELRGLGVSKGRPADLIPMTDAHDEVAGWWWKRELAKGNVSGTRGRPGWRSGDC